MATKITRGLIVFFVFGFLACSTKQVPPQLPMRPQTDAETAAQQKMLFPDGQYKQNVMVKVTAPEQKRNFDFTALIVKSPENFLFYGYGDFGFTLFKIQEKHGQPVEMETSIEQIEKKKDFFLKIFGLVKKILSLQKSDPRLKDNIIHLNQDEIEARVELSDYDQKGVPKKIKVNSEKQMYEVLISG